jgi:hypothetical protein
VEVGVGVKVVIPLNDGVVVEIPFRVHLFNLLSRGIHQKDRLGAGTNFSSEPVVST